MNCKRNFIFIDDKGIEERFNIEPSKDRLSSILFITCPFLYFDLNNEE